MGISTNSWFWFTVGSTVSAIMAVKLTDDTLDRKYKLFPVILSWLAAIAAYFAFVYYGMVYTNPNWFSYFVFFGWIIFLTLPAIFLYKEKFSTKLFTITSGIFLANVTTFISGGITTTLFAFNPYDFATGYKWSIPFSIIKFIISAITAIAYLVFARKAVREVFVIMEGKMSRFGSIPFIASIGFFFIAQIAGIHNIMPNAGFDFILFYGIVCLVFAVMYWLIFSNVLWSSRAMKTQTELNVANKIQHDMLPCIFPPFPERDDIDIYASMLPAKEVGGDFYDFFLIDDTHLAVVVADVSGKGIPAALFMVIAKTLIKNYASLNMPPKDVFTAANNQLCEGNESGMFVTAFMGIIDLETGSFTFVNAGHNPPCIKRADGDFEWLKLPSGFVLAGMEGIKYKEQEITLNYGDTIYMYTDGVTEATNIKNELFTEPALLKSLNVHKDDNLHDLLVNIKRDIDSFVLTAPQFDDITMLAITFKGGKNQPKETPNE